MKPLVLLAVLYFDAHNHFMAYVTWAYPISRMPLGLPLLNRLWIDPLGTDAGDEVMAY